MQCFGYNHPEGAREMGAKGRQYVIRIDRKKIMDRYLKLLEEVPLI